MKRMMWKLLTVAGLSAVMGLALMPSPAMAQKTTKEICDNGVDDDGDKAVDCDDSDCSADPFCKPPQPKGFCHNIGGPELAGGGANCDPVSGSCTVTEDGTGRTFTVSSDEFFGIVIGTTSP